LKESKIKDLVVYRREKELCFEIIELIKSRIGFYNFEEKKNSRIRFVDKEDLNNLAVDRISFEMTLNLDLIVKIYNELLYYYEKEQKELMFNQIYRSMNSHPYGDIELYTGYKEGLTKS
jgi:hypothetical protein